MCAAAGAALDGLCRVMWQMPSDELGSWLSELDELAARAAAARVVVAVEAQARGVIEASRSGTTVAWLRDHAPTLAAGGAGAVAKAVAVCRDRDLGPVADAVFAGTLAPAVAVTVAGEFDRVRRRVTDEARSTVLDALVAVGATHGSAAVRELRERLVARHGLPDEFQRECDQAAAFVALTRGVRDGALWSYRLTLDTESRAVLEASISTLSAPATDKPGRRDLRSAARRRAEALTEVCRRAIAAPSGVPGPGLKSVLMLTMDLADLRAGICGAASAASHPPGTAHPPGTCEVQATAYARRSGAASLLGSLATGELVGPQAARKHACAAGVIPTVLGGEGEILDQGRMTRLVTAGQLAALWLRDRRCSFPGCDVPAAWSDAHHLVHWIDGGASDLANLTLLCGRHHAIVHRDRLCAGVLPGGEVVWDLMAGSYDRQLAGVAARAGPAGATATDPLGTTGSPPTDPLGPAGSPPTDRPSPAA